MKNLLDDKKSCEMWDDYVLKHPQSWFWATTQWLLYSLAYNPKAIDRSFIVSDARDKILGVCPLIQEGDSFSMGGDPCAWPLAADVFCMGQIGRRIDLIAKENGIKIGRWRLGPLVDDSAWFPFSEFKDISWQSQVINLGQTLNEIWDGVRDGHKAEIHRGLRELTFSNTRSVEEFHKLHVEANTKETRPWKTWELNTEWWNEGLIDILIAYRAGKQCGGAIFLKYKDSVYYASGAYPEDHVAHAVIWTAIRHYHNLGMKALEIGWLNTGSLAQFKKGFGGEAKKIYVIEKTWP